MSSKVEACQLCSRKFGSRRALQQHLESPAHAASSHRCEPCNRSFASDEALQQHLQDAPVHARVYTCEPCNRSYTSDEALQQHLRDSPAHATPTHACEPCNRTFKTAPALQDHLQDSPAHKVSPDTCTLCDRSFTSAEALQQHIRDSPRHQDAPSTPVDDFFRSFPPFQYNAALPPATSYALLQKHKRWQRDDPESKDAWDRYQRALQDELRMWYGEEDDLTAWHALCRAVGIQPLPLACEACEEALRKTHVNIIDLIEWGRKRGDSEEPVRTFRTVQQLREYTKKSGKIFHFEPNEEDRNVVLRHLLRKIFRL